MIARFDIFRVQQDGSLRWCETSETLEAAKARVELFDTFQPAAQYLILDQETGQRTVVEAPASAPPQLPPANPGEALYHICRVDKEKLRWVEGAESLQVAEARIKVLKAFYPGDYLVLDYNPERGDPFGPWPTLTFVLSTFNL